MGFDRKRHSHDARIYPAHPFRIKIPRLCAAAFYFRQDWPTRSTGAASSAAGPGRAFSAAANIQAEPGYPESARPTSCALPFRQAAQDLLRNASTQRSSDIHAVCEWTKTRPFQLPALSGEQAARIPPIYRNPYTVGIKKAFTVVNRLPVLFR